MFQQGRHATDMVVMVVGEQDRAQGELAFGQCLLHRGGIARIDNDGVAGVVVQQPDVIVGKRR
jgi:hypothetical protein